MNDVASTAEPVRVDNTVGPRWRRVLVVVLVVLTCTSILVSSVAVWAHRTLLNTDSWVSAVGPLAKDPKVINAVATKVGSEVTTAISNRPLAQDLPSAIRTPITGVVDQFVVNTVTKLLETDQFQTFWVAANRRVHEAAVKVLRGDTKYIKTNGGTVSLNFLPLIAKALTFVNDKAPGILNGATIPEITQDTPPDQARAELSSALGRDLPDDFGVITVFKSDQLKAAQDAVNLFDKLTIAILVLTVLLLVATILLALDKRKVVIWLGLGTVLAIGIAVAIGHAVRDQIIGLIGNEQARGAAKATINQLINRLDLITHVLLALGLAAALIAFLTGGSGAARAIRRQSARLARAVGGQPDEHGDPAGLVWVRHHVTVLRWAVLAVGVLLLLFIVQGWGGLFLTLMIVGLAEAALSFAGRSAGGPPSVTTA